MSVFGIFKKGKSSAENIVPRCVYCEHGKPARSSGKILCSKCGMVNSNFSCKKFVLSSFLYATEKSSENIFSGNSSEKDINKTDEENNQPLSQSESHSENIIEKKDVPENHAPQKTEIPSYNITQKNTDVQDKPEHTSEPVMLKNKNHVTAQVQQPVITEQTTLKKDTQKENNNPSISNIRFSPPDNSEKIKKLAEIAEPKLVSIENHQSKKKIILPNTDDFSVSSISNTYQPKNAEDYLKTVDVREVSFISFNTHTHHELPDNTAHIELKNMK